MQTTYHDILLQILDAIEYAEDREAYIKTCLELIEQEAFTELTKSLSEKEQKKIQVDVVLRMSAPEKAREKLHAHFTDEQMKTIFEQKANDKIIEILKAVSPTLNDTQKQKLTTIIQKFSPDTAPTSEPQQA